MSQVWYQQQHEQEQQQQPLSWNVPQHHNIESRNIQDQDLITSSPPPSFIPAALHGKSISVSNSYSPSSTGAVPSIAPSSASSSSSPQQHQDQRHRSRSQQQQRMTHGSLSPSNNVVEKQSSLSPTRKFDRSIFRRMYDSRKQQQEQQQHQRELDFDNITTRDNSSREKQGNGRNVRDDHHNNIAPKEDNNKNTTNSSSSPPPPTSREYQKSFKPNDKTSINTSPHRRHVLVTANPADGLSTLRHGPHITIQQLRSQLTEAQARESLAQTTSAKSDAIIVELKHSQRDLKSQLEATQRERGLHSKRYQTVLEEKHTLERDVEMLKSTLRRSEHEVQTLFNQVESVNQADEYVGEMQIKLDRAAAELLTADMKLRDRHDEHLREMANVKKQLDERDQIIGELQRKIFDMEGSSMERQQSIRNLEETVRELRGSVETASDYTQDAIAREGALTALEGKLASTNTRLNNCKIDKEHYRSLSEEYRQQLEEQKRQHEKERTTLEQQYNQKLSTRTETLSSQYQSQMQQKEEAHETAVLALNQTIQKQTREHETLQIKITKLESLVSSATDELDRTRGELQELHVSKEQSRLKQEEHHRCLMQEQQDIILDLQQKQQQHQQKQQSDDEKNAKHTSEEIHELQQRIQKLEADRSELKHCLGEAMSELEVADTEAQVVHELHMAKDRLERKVEEMNRLLDERNGKVLELQSKCWKLEKKNAYVNENEIEFAKKERGTKEEGQEEAEVKHLRNQLNHILQWIKEYNNINNATNRSMGTVTQLKTSKRRIRQTKEIHSSVNDPDVLSIHSYVESMHLKLYDAEEVLEQTHKDLDDLRRKRGASDGSDNNCHNLNTSDKDDVYNNKDEGKSEESLQKMLKDTKERCNNLEAEISMMKGDLKAKEEGAEVLRKSLKDAVELLKPLKQHVKEAEKGKEEMRIKLWEEQERARALEEQLKKSNGSSSVEQGVQNGGKTRGLLPIDETETPLQKQLKSQEEEIVHLRLEVEQLEGILKDMNILSVGGKEGESRIEFHANMVNPEQAAVSPRVLQVHPMQPFNEENNKKLLETEAKLKKAKDDLKARQTAESTLKSMLKTTQGKLHQLTKKQKAMEKEKEELQEKIATTEKRSETHKLMYGRSNADFLRQNEELATLRQAERSRSEELEKNIILKDDEISKLQSEIRLCKDEAKRKDDDVVKVKEQLRQSEMCVSSITGGSGGLDSLQKMQAMAEAAESHRNQVEELENEVDNLHSQLKEISKNEEIQKSREKELADNVEELNKAVKAATEKVTSLEDELLAAKTKIEAMDKSEKTLKKSLKESMALLKQLKHHLKAAEKENNQMKKELTSANEQIATIEKEGITPTTKMMPSKDSDLQYDKERLELLVHQLEQEKNELQIALKQYESNCEALNNTSTTNSMKSKLDSSYEMEEQIVEMQSRYEVTKKKLEKIIEENRILHEDLAQMEKEEAETAEEMEILRNKLSAAQGELDNAKYIATSAVMKVEELNEEMSQMSQMSRDGDTSNLCEITEIDTGYDIEEEDETEVHELREMVETLRVQVKVAKETNDGLEATIREKDNLLNSFNEGVGELSSIEGETSYSLDMDDFNIDAPPHSRTQSPSHSSEQNTIPIHYQSSFHESLPSRSRSPRYLG